MGPPLEGTGASVWLALLQTLLACVLWRLVVLRCCLSLLRVSCGQEARGYVRSWNLGDVLRYLRQRLHQAYVALAAVSVDSLGRLLLVRVCVVVQNKEFDLLSLTVAQVKK